MKPACSAARTSAILFAIATLLAPAPAAPPVQGSLSTGAAVPAHPCGNVFCPTPPTKVKGHVSADNFHAVYSADCEGTNMVVTQHAPQSGSGCEWNDPATYDFSTPNRYIYIAAWSDDVVAQGLLHDLTFNGEKAFSGSPAWRVYPTGADRDLCSQTPTPAEMKEWIKEACRNDGWKTTLTSGPTNTAASIASWGMVTTWYPLPATSAEAKWTWYDSGACGGFPQPLVGGCNHAELLIFRMHVSFVHGYVSADNYFNVFTADDEVASPRVTFRGKGCKWQSSTPLCFTTTDRYIYIFGWSDHAGRQGLIHDLRRNGEVMFSNDPFWTVAPTSSSLSSCFVLSTSAAATQIWGAVSGPDWVPTTVGATNGTLWPLLTCISTLARWSWYESGNCPGPSSPFAPGCDHDEKLIFRHELFGRCGC